MKAIASLIAVTALAGTAFAVQGYSKVPKPLELSVGAGFFTGDIKDVYGVDNGYLVGLDYHMNQFSVNSTGFVGVRGWFGNQSGVTVNTYGAHYGVKFGMGSGAGQMSSMDNLYFKIAGGYYNTDNDATTNKWGFGGFAAIGWEMHSGFSLEGGYQMGPSVAGDNNTSWYVAGTFRF